MRVVIGMSGGVDSAASAVLLVQAGHDVVGVTLRLWDGEEGLAAARRCCAPDDLRDAARTATALGIPHYVLDERAAFLDRVVRPFARAYAGALTPNPCVVCNAEVKLPALRGFARRVGAERIATGHYAGVEVEAGRVRLRRGADGAKDQSYFLSRVPADVLAMLVTPLAGIDKRAARDVARRRGLAVAGKVDSQEACFLGRDGVAPIVGRFADSVPAPGRVRLESGEVVGGHRGVHLFTVGQRRRLGAAPGGRRRYVLRIDARTGDVVVGERSELGSSVVRATDFAWLVDAPRREIRCAVQVRSGARPVRATAATSGVAGEVVAALAAPAVICPGQAVVLYDGAVVLGAGWIAAGAGGPG